MINQFFDIMMLADIIHYQINGFKNAGKKIVPPKNKKELSLSRVISLALLLFTIGWYSVVTGLGSGIPIRIHLRAFIYLIPSLGIIITFYRGVSTS